MADYQDQDQNDHAAAFDELNIPSTPIGTLQKQVLDHLNMLKLAEENMSLRIQELREALLKAKTFNAIPSIEYTRKIRDVIYVALGEAMKIPTGAEDFEHKKLMKSLNEVFIEMGKLCSNKNTKFTSQFESLSLN